MSDAVATLEIRDASNLSEVNALALGRKIATRLITGIIRQGSARAELHIRPWADRDLLCEWLEGQGLKLIVDRREYAQRYTAKLYAEGPSDGTGDMSDIGAS